MTREEPWLTPSPNGKPLILYVTWSGNWESLGRTEEDH